MLLGERGGAYDSGEEGVRMAKKLAKTGIRRNYQRQVLVWSPLEWGQSLHLLNGVEARDEVLVSWKPVKSLSLSLSLSLSIVNI